VEPRSRIRVSVTSVLPRSPISRSSTGILVKRIKKLIVGDSKQKIKKDAKQKSDDYSRTSQDATKPFTRTGSTKSIEIELSPLKTYVGIWLTWRLKRPCHMKTGNR
jgi:hypothetical protein